MTQEWIRRAQRRFPDLKVFRTHLFFPVHHAESANRAFNRVFGDSGDNLSVPLSRTGEGQPEYLGSSGAFYVAWLSGIHEVVEQHEGAMAFVVGNSDNVPSEVIAVLGAGPVRTLGTLATFASLCEELGLVRIIPPELLDSNTSGYEVILQTVITLGETTSEGQVVEAVALPWFAILKEIENDPSFLHEFSKHPRKFEEFIAGAYELEGWPEVTLTPRTRDRGRDIIVARPGFASIRILDQVKAYSPGTLVTHEEVRAMLGVLSTDTNASKGIITTTSDFQPEILSSGEFEGVIPYRLELKNGIQLRKWLASLRSES